MLLSLEYQVVSLIRKEIGIGIAQCVNYHVNCGALRRLLGALTTGSTKRRPANLEGVAFYGEYVIVSTVDASLSRQEEADRN